MEKWWELEPLPADAPEELGDECEAFQAGRWAEFRSARGREVPSWAWLNQVAHVSETDLRVLVRARVWRRRKADEWTGLRAAEIEERWPQSFASWRSDPDAAPPGG